MRHTRKDGRTVEVVELSSLAHPTRPGDPANGPGLYLLVREANGRTVGYASLEVSR